MTASRACIFFSLDAGNLSAVWGARIFYRLPYWKAAHEGERARAPTRSSTRSKREHGPKPAVFRGSYRPTSAAFHAVPGSIQHFLSERYCLYACNRKRLYRGGHPSSAVVVAGRQLRRLEENTMASVAGIALPSQPSLTYFSRELKVLVWAPERLV